MMDPLEVLLSRRSVLARNLGEPGPNRAKLELILSAGIRVPDHGRLTPWRFVRIAGQARDTLGDMIAVIFQKHNPEATEHSVEIEKNRFSRAPVVIAVISSVREHPKIPEWEQVLSAGACCINILNAAHALGFSAQWLTEWYAYNPEVRKLLALQCGERIAGFIHIGTAIEAPSERIRPEITEILTDWENFTAF